MAEGTAREEIFDRLREILRTYRDTLPVEAKGRCR
jgi:hypothetical protein